jgi:peptidoglycan/xylan/chitin deacetylase (PgdA/CDA1 family)
MSGIVGTFRGWSAAVLLCLGAAPALAANPFSQGMVSITLDDGWATQYTSARPALNSRGIRSTYFLITNALSQNWGGYLTVAQVQTLKVDGNELACHTLTHPDLTTLSATQLNSELQDSQAWLVNNLGLASVPDFAPPYGAYNATVLAGIKQYYGSSRTVNGGRNFRDTVIYELRGNDVTRTVHQRHPHARHAVQDGELHRHPRLPQDARRAHRHGVRGRGADGGPHRAAPVGGHGHLRRRARRWLPGLELGGALAGRGRRRARGPHVHPR